MNVLREATMILDCVGVSQRDCFLRSGRTTEEVGARICAVFGGYTADAVVGCWINHAGEVEMDSGFRFHVAIPPVQWRLFCELAKELAEGQKTVYVISPSGSVHILDVPGPSAPGLELEEEDMPEPEEDLTEEILNGTRLESWPEEAA